MSARVVVTGGCGFIGAHLVDRLVARGDEVTVIDSALPAIGRPAWADQVRFVAGDIRDADRLAEVISPGVDMVYHLAAVVGVDQYLARPLDVIDINVTGTRAVLDLACRAGARVVLASTSEVFGKNPAVPWREDDDRVLGTTSADRWTYATSKALTEHLAYAFSRQHGLATTIVRYFNVYGPRQRPAYLVSRSVHRALNGRPVVVYDQGGQTRCFTFVADAVAGTLAAAENPNAVGESFNIGSMTENTVAEVADLIGKLTGSDTRSEVDTQTTLGTAYEDLARRIPDTRKAGSQLNWQCEVPLRDGLSRTIQWARTNPWWLALPDTGAS